jgi:hypothetical protein
MDALLADRAEQQPTDASSAARSDDQQVGAQRRVEQRASRTGPHRDQLHRSRAGSGAVGRRLRHLKQVVARLRQELAVRTGRSQTHRHHHLQGVVRVHGVQLGLAQRGGLGRPAQRTGRGL